MSIATTLVFADTERLRRKWGWFLALGIALIVLGIICLFLLPIATFAGVLLLSWLMMLGGVVEIIHGFQVRGWGGMLLHIMVGLLGVLVGLMIVTHPVAGALAWTMLLASFFTVIGIFRVIAAIQMRFANWGWAVFDGVVTVALGVLLWLEWPWSGLWFLGLALGISMLLRGWSCVMMALALRVLPTVSTRLREAA